MSVLHHLRALLYSSATLSWLMQNRPSKCGLCRYVKASVAMER